MIAHVNFLLIGISIRFNLAALDLMMHIFVSIVVCAIVAISILRSRAVCGFIHLLRPFPLRFGAQREGRIEVPINVGDLQLFLIRFRPFFIIVIVRAFILSWRLTNCT